MWLCSNGSLELTITFLGRFFKSSLFEPKFPVFCYQRFNIEGYFKSISCYHELQDILNGEKFEISLWQSGRRLAFYIGKVMDILSSNNIQMLMATSHSFPVSIA